VAVGEKLSSMRAGALARSDPLTAETIRTQSRTDRRAVRAAWARRDRRAHAKPVIGVLLALSAPLAVSVAVSSTVPVLVAMLLVLPLLVLAHRRRPTPMASGQVTGLAALSRLSVGVVVVTVFGSVVAIMLALFLNGLGIGGSGGTLLEALLTICVLAPCFSLGARCGRWWSFAGSLPILGLFAIGPSLLALIALAATACSLQLGSLHRLDSNPRRDRIMRSAQ
jgi:hypothetical protein